MSTINNTSYHEGDMSIECLQTFKHLTNIDNKSICYQVADGTLRNKFISLIESFFLGIELQYILNYQKITLISLYIADT